MKRVAFLIVAAICLGSFAFGQPEDEGVNIPDGQLLNAVQLREARWFYTMEEAKAYPDQVYKLSLAEFHMKELPAEIFQFKNLQILNLNSCGLEKLSDSIHVFHNLQFLSLYDNKLRYIPQGIRELKNLEVLYLGKNKLFEIPLWVGGLGKIHRLDISRNRMTPLEVSRIRSLMPKAEITY
jgi:Leucine-rich repeat (LRR) protein